MPLVNFELDPELIKDLDICAKINHQNRSVYLRTLIIDAIKTNEKDAPNAFKAAGNE